MKIKIDGFKVGESRPTANRTFERKVPESFKELPSFDENNDNYSWIDSSYFDLGVLLHEVLKKSDFISIRRVKE